MAQAAGSTRFLQEPLAQLFAVAAAHPFLHQHLERDPALDVRILGQVDPPHGAAPQLRQHTVSMNPLRQPWCRHGDILCASQERCFPARDAENRQGAHDLRSTVARGGEEAHVLPPLLDEMAEEAHFFRA